jgi:hypothetical protein
MKNKEAADVIVANWPPKNCTLLREALTVALNSMVSDDMIKRGNPELLFDPPHFTVKNIVLTLDHAIKHMSTTLRQSEAHIESVIDKQREINQHIARLTVIAEALTDFKHEMYKLLGLIGDAAREHFTKDTCLIIKNAIMQAPASYNIHALVVKSAKLIGIDTSSEGITIESISREIKKITDGAPVLGAEPPRETIEPSVSGAANVPLTADNKPGQR